MCPDSVRGSQGVAVFGASALGASAQLLVDFDDELIALRILLADREERDLGSRQPEHPLDVGRTHVRELDEVRRAAIRVQEDPCIGFRLTRHWVQST